MRLPYLTKLRSLAFYHLILFVYMYYVVALHGKIFYISHNIPVL